MIVKNILFAVVLAFACARAHSYGPSSEAGGEPGWWLLRLGADAKQASMGGAGSSIDGNLTGFYYNPAALGRLKSDGAGAFYRSLFGGGVYYIATAAHKFGPVTPLPGESFAGISFVQTRSGEAEKTTLLRDSEGSFSDNNTALILTYAYPFGDALDLGANLKFVSQSVGEYQSSSAGADLGAVARFKCLNVSMCAQNAVKPSIKLKESPDRFPLNLTFGLSSSFRGGAVAPAADFTIEEADGEKNILWKTGVSYRASPVVDVRAGANNRELSGGFGVKSDPFTFDYAFLWNTLGIEHLFSVKVNFSPFSTDEADLYYKSRKKLDNEFAEVQRVKKTYDRLINSAIEYFLNGQYTAARDEFRAAVNIDPSIAPDRADIMKIEIKIGEKLQREKILKLFDAARNRFKNSDYDGCIKITDKILDMDPANNYAISMQSQSRAYKAINAGDYKKAEGYLTDVLKIDPENAIIRRLLKRLRAFMEYNKTRGKGGRK